MNEIGRDTKTIEVSFSYTFEADVEGFDPDYVDLAGLAKESALRNLKDLIADNQITEEDFEITRVDNA